MAKIVIHNGRNGMPRIYDDRSEHDIQVECVKMFRMLYGHKYPFFAVPNGEYRTPTTAARLKAEGVLSGVSDLILLAPSADGKYHSLCIEMKKPKGKVSSSQYAFKSMAEANGNKFVVCRSTEEFINEIRSYLNG